MVRTKIGSVGAAAFAAAFLNAAAQTSVQTASAPGAPRAGDTYEITMTKESAQRGNYGQSGNSDDHDAIIERVIGLRADGLELEYDDPPNATPEAENWQLPARILKPPHGPAQLLNGPQLEARRDSWLKAAGLPRTMCGHYIFTWNVFRIECDPQSAIEMIEAFDVGSPNLRDGASYQDADAREPGKIARKTAGPDGAMFAVEMPVNPDTVIHARAEADVVVGEIMRKPVTLDTALRERAKEIVSGTISIEFETDSTGNVRRRTKVTTLDIEEPNGRTETETTTETLERRLVSRHD